MRRREWHAICVCAFLAVTKAHSWLDVEPQNDRCFRIIYRFERDEGQVSGWCNVVDSDLNPIDTKEARPYHQDVSASNSAWVGSNTTSLCNDELATTSGWSQLMCFGYTVDGLPTAPQNTLLVWHPLSHLLYTHDGAMHESTLSYVMSWVTLEGRYWPKSTQAMLQQLPRTKLSRVHDSSQCIDFSTRMPSRNNATANETYCPLQSTSGYPHHSLSHSPYTKMMGTAFYFPPIESGTNWHSTPHDERSYEDALQQKEGKRTVGSRLRKVRRLVSYLQMTSW
jgi:hypothetical protein